jgi:hypothetical protein
LLSSSDVVTAISDSLSSQQTLNPTSSQVPRSASDGGPGGLGEPNSATRLPEIHFDLQRLDALEGQCECFDED